MVWDTPEARLARVRQAFGATTSPGSTRTSSATCSGEVRDDAASSRRCVGPGVGEPRRRMTFRLAYAPSAARMRVLVRQVLPRRLRRVAVKRAEERTKHIAVA